MVSKLLPVDRPAAARPAGRYRVDLRAELAASSAAELWRIGVRRVYRDKQLVQLRGGSADHALLVLSGRLRSVAHTADGTERLMRWMEPGEVGGLSTILADAPLPVDLVASGRTELLLLPRQALLQWLATDAAACLVMARLLSLRVNELLDVVFTRASQTLAARVWATVQRLALENGESLGGGRTLLRMSQGDLAHAVGASRQRVNEELCRLQADGKLRLGYRRIELVDP